MKRYVLSFILVLVGTWIVSHSAIFAQKNIEIDQNNFNLKVKINEKGNVELNWNHFEADEIIIARNKQPLVKFEGKVPTSFVDEYPLPYQKNTYRIVATRKGNRKTAESIYTSLTQEASVPVQIKSTTKFVCHENQTALLSIPEAKEAIYKWFKDGKPYPHSLDLSVLSIRGSGKYHAEVTIGDKIHQIEPIMIPEGNKIDLQVRTIRNASGKIVRLETEKKQGVSYTWIATNKNSPKIQFNKNGTTIFGDHFGFGESFDVPMGIEKVMLSAQLDGGCGAGKSIEVDQALTGEVDFADIYPNPFAERFTLRLKNATKGSIKLNIFDLQGKEIWQFEAKSENTLFEKEINLSEQAKGAYLLRVQTEEGTWTQKLLKE